MQSSTVSNEFCSKCGVLRSPAWFTKGPGPTGLHSWCRPCSALYTKQTGEMNKLQRELRTPVTEKSCSKCSKMLPIHCFHRCASSKDGYKSCCKDCNIIVRSALKAKRQESSGSQTLKLGLGTERICSQCLINKPWADFNKLESSTFGIVSCCKQCMSDSYKREKLERRSSSSG